MTFPDFVQADFVRKDVRSPLSLSDASRYFADRSTAQFPVEHVANVADPCAFQGVALGAKSPWVIYLMFHSTYFPSTNVRSERPRTYVDAQQEENKNFIEFCRKFRAELYPVFKLETKGHVIDYWKIQEIIKGGPEHIGPTIDRCCEDPNDRVFAQALLDNAFEDYFLLQLAMFANKNVNVYVTIEKWKNAGLKLPAEGTPEYYPY
jgi:hypothetical protein